MTQSKRDNLIVVGLLAALVVAAVVFVYLPQQRRLRDLRTRVARQKVQLADSSDRAAAVPDMLRQVQAMRVRYSNFDRRLPQQKELGGFLKEISGNLAEADLSDQMIRPGSPKHAALFHTLPITLRFKSSYLSLAGLLKQLEEMKRLTQVEKLSIFQRDRERPGAASELDVEVLMNIYFTKS